MRGFLDGRGGRWQNRRGNDSAVLGCNGDEETVRVEEDKGVGENCLVFPGKVERQ